MKRLIAPLSCFLLLVMTSPSRGDFLIMKNGQVIEGKFKSYDPVRKTFVLITDEKGTTKTLKESDLKLRVPTPKTTWKSAPNTSPSTRRRRSPR
jgi:hypothetical protein